MSEGQSSGKPSKVHPHRHLEYMRPDTTITLRAGLAEYYGTITNLITDKNAAADVAALFRFHDVCHVIFGCDTSPRGEALADTWSIFGSTVSLATYRRYMALPETKAIFASLSLGDMVRMAGESTLVVPLAMWRATRMRRKWPFDAFEPYLDLPLAATRCDFGIDVVT
jgi:hypothetical protein